VADIVMKREERLSDIRWRIQAAPVMDVKYLLSIMNSAAC